MYLNPDQIQSTNKNCEDNNFCGICRRQCHYKFNTVFWKSCIVFCAKLMEVNPFKPFPNKPWSLRVWSTILLKTLWEKEKLLVTSNFSFSHCFLLVLRTFCHFHLIWNCRLQTLWVWRSLKFVVWERVKLNFDMTIKCFDSTQIYNWQWITSWIIGTFFFYTSTYTRYSILLAQRYNNN